MFLLHASLRVRVADGEKKIKNRDSKKVPTPFVNTPLNFLQAEARGGEPPLSGRKRDLWDGKRPPSPLSS